jgi:hypothetical protein
MPDSDEMMRQRASDAAEVALSNRIHLRIIELLWESDHYAGTYFLTWETIQASPEIANVFREWNYTFECLEHVRELLWKWFIPRNSAWRFVGTEKRSKYE